MSGAISGTGKKPACREAHAGPGPELPGGCQEAGERDDRGGHGGDVTEVWQWGAVIYARPHESRTIPAATHRGMASCRRVDCVGGGTGRQDSQRSGRACRSRDLHSLRPEEHRLRPTAGLRAPTGTDRPRLRPDPRYPAWTRVTRNENSVRCPQGRRPVHPGDRAERQPAIVQVPSYSL